MRHLARRPLPVHAAQVPAVSPEESPDVATSIDFSDLQLHEGVLRALSDVGYETPTAIQAEVIPHILAGRDVIGQAQTGTGKTAAFALPLLTRIDLANPVPQVLVLAPTRELAIQVAEAFHSYAAHLPGFHVLPIYGGQDYGVQLRGLRRGVHVVVGTPGRVMDHMRRGTLDLRGLTSLVLDEADEMLRMGFIDDVEWVLEQTPPQRQVALFSATMPPPIRKIAERYLRDPQQISIRLATTTAATIRQRYWVVSGLHKLDALTRMLETENCEGVLIFMRTKIATTELAEKLDARGYSCAAINGDMPQKAREKTIEQLKDGQLDILVATDVAARGLDVDRISHVVNYDIPHDPEVYVHRIGRTGRAGRHGDAILFVAPRETRMLQVIERATRQPIERMDVPSAEVVNDKRVGRFMQAITDTIASHDLEFFQQLVARFQREHDADPVTIAAALARMVQGDQPMLLEPERRGGRPSRDDHRRDGRDERPPARGDYRPARDERGASARPPYAEPRRERPASRADEPSPRTHERTDDAYPVRPVARPQHPRVEQAPRERGYEARPPRDDDRPPFRPASERGERSSVGAYAARQPRPAAAPRPPRGDFNEHPPRADFNERPPRGDVNERPPRSDAGERPPRLGLKGPPPAGMEGFRLEVGHLHGVLPGNIVGAIANEAGIDSRDIGRIQIHDDHSTVDLPTGMPKEVLMHLRRVWVSGQQLLISRLDDAGGGRNSVRVHDKEHKKDRHRDRKNKGAPRRFNRPRP